MTTQIKQEDIIEPVAPTSEDTPTEQDPLQDELARVQGGRTEEEKATFTFKKQAERLTTLGIDPLTALGVQKPAPTNTTDDDAPVTVGMLKKIQADEASKTALQLADSITNPTERDLVKWHLQNTIRSTGNPQQDLELATSLVNAVKNKQVIEEIGRRPGTKPYTSTGGARPSVEPQEELTPQEMEFMKAPFNLTRDQIIKARQ